MIAKSLRLYCSKASDQMLFEVGHNQATGSETSGITPKMPVDRCHVHEGILVFVVGKLGGMVARDGIEPPMPALQGRLPHRGKWFENQRILLSLRHRALYFGFSMCAYDTRASRPIQPSTIESAYL